MKAGKSKRFKIYASLTAMFAFLFVIGLTLSITDFKNPFFNGLASEQDNYLITLDNSNRITSSGDHNQKTKLGNNVAFTYSGVSSSTTGHVTLNNGILTNKNWIRSITSVKAKFAQDTSNAELKFKCSFGGDVWGDEVSMVSEQPYALGSNPYYLMFTSVGTITIESLEIKFACTVNPEAHEGETPTESDTYVKVTDESDLTDGKYLIVYEEESVAFNGSLTTLDATNNNVAVTISGDTIKSSKLGDKTFTYNSTDKTLQSASGYYIGQDTYANGLKQSTTTKYENTITFYEDGDAEITVSTSEGDVLLRFNNSSNQNRFRYYRSGQEYITLYKQTGGSIDYDEPDPFEVGFTVTYNNELNEDSIFNNDGNVVVKKVMSDGTQSVVSSGYTVKVLTYSTEAEVDTSKPFGYDSRPGANDYKLVVEYGDFIPFESNFSVGENIYVTDIESTFDQGNTVINTANSFNDFIEDYSVSLTLRRGNPITGIAYSSFSTYSQYGLALTLLDPSGVSHQLNTPFGTAGTWTLRTSTTKNACVDESTFVVDPILVTDITVTGTLSIEEGKTTQLTAGIEPANATNQLIDWTSNNENVATVSETGLVTAVSVGTATITATAKDGSGVYGSVTITVTEKQVSPDYELVTSASSLAVGQKVIIATDPDKAKAISTTQNTNNRAATDVTISNNKIASEGLSNSVEVFTLEAGTTSGTFAFKSSTGYIYAASKEKNYLKTETTKSANSSFVVSISGSDATITAQGNNTRNTIRYNPNTSAQTPSPLFSCYASDTTTGYAPRLYVSSGAKVYPTSISIDSTASVSVGSTKALSVSYTPSNANVKELSWRSSNTAVATVDGGIVTGVKAGTATIYAKAATKTGYTAEVGCTVTVNNVAVTGVTLDKSSGTLSIDDTVTLIPTVAPSNATNKAVTWSTSNSSVATIVDGVVTAKSAGTATITVRTTDGGFTATYSLTVVSSGGGGGGGGVAEWSLVTDASALSAGDVIVLVDVTSGEVAGNVSSQVLTSVSGATFSSNNSIISSLPSDAVQFTLGESEGAWTLSNSNGMKLGATAVKKVAWGGGTDKWSISISGDGDATIQNQTSSYGRFLYNNDNPRFTTYTSNVTSNMRLPQIYVGGSADPIDPTGITLNPTELELSAGQSSSLTATITPSNANQNKAITWSSSNEAVATVDNGSVTVKSTASAGQSATITAKLNDAPNKPTATATITVAEEKLDEWTILMYISGSNLESDGGYATGDMAEILQLRNSQPDDVNIVMQTGGSTAWQNYNISASKVGRYSIEPGKSSPTLVQSLSQRDMGLSSTLQDFIEWGVTNYPAQKTGLIFWNHGGALDGCCWDDNYNGQYGDPLTNDECLSAFKNAFKTLGRSEPLEWVGYDCCLMAVQDIAEFNSPYFKYMVSSQESESGYGWDYDKWVDDLYAKKSTETILKAIVDSFIAEQGTSSDQTLSVLNLQNMAAYKTAWEAMASALSTKYITSSSAFSTLKGYVNTAVKYGYSSKYNTAANNYGYVYDIFNVSDVLSKFASNYPNCSSEISAAQTTLNNLVTYNKCGTKAKTSCGVCCFFPISQYGTSSYYTTSITHFTNWRSLCFKYS